MLNGMLRRTTKFQSKNKKIPPLTECETIKNSLSDCHFNIRKIHKQMIERRQINTLFYN